MRVALLILLIGGIGFALIAFSLPISGLLVLLLRGCLPVAGLIRGLRRLAGFRLAGGEIHLRRRRIGALRGKITGLAGSRRG